MPTLLALSGTEIPASLDGIDLTPVLKGEERIIRDWLHFEHATCYSEEQAFHALTDGHYKYIWRPLKGEEQLFDLDQDGQETRNLSVETAYRSVLEQWRSRLIGRLSTRPEGFSINGQLVAGCRYEPLNHGTLRNP